ncbi:dihydrolipoyl dehydrogenase family protein [Bacteroidota bacterium]
MGYDYDSVILGGGIAGLTAAAISANLGARTALVEADRHGGGCTWTGGVPSKALIRAAAIAHTIRTSSSYGIVTSDPVVEFDRVMANVHRIREQIYRQSDSPEIFKSKGVDIVSGRGRFVDPHTIAVDGNDPRTVTARYIFIATGSVPTIPDIAGLADSPFITNESIFDIKDLPQSFGILGTGHVGCELAQAFQRLGSSVTLIEERPGILEGDDEELSSMLQEIIEDEGVRFLLGAKVTKIVSAGVGSILEIEQGGAVKNLSVDQLLVAVGRSPNLVHLGLDAAGVEFSKTGIDVDDHGRTSVKHIYAIGDITGRGFYTHMAEHEAKVAVLSALLKSPVKFDGGHAVRCTFTDPELAHVGASEADLKKAGASYHMYRFPYNRIDRAIIDGHTKGWIKVFARKATGRILGADILGHGAGEQIAHFAVAMRNGVTLRQMADTIHPYPTYATGSRRAADQWYVQNQSEGLTRFLQKTFRLKGPTPDLSDPHRIV